jgi:hypothetical protein
MDLEKEKLILEIKLLKMQIQKFREEDNF